MAMEVTQVLLNSQSMDGAVRKQAEHYLQCFHELDLPCFLISLATELANDEKPVDSRMQAGLFLKNALDSKEQHKKIEFVQRWLAIDSTFRAQIEVLLLRTLSSPSHNARSIASQLIAKVAGIELPYKQWPELIVSLLSNFHQLLTATRQATLETLGYICEEVSPALVNQGDVNKILSAVVKVMDSTEQNSDVRLAAIQALSNALGFAKDNFSDDMDRDCIMRVIFEAALSPEIKIRGAAFECLVAISSTYYEKLAQYIETIFTITAKAIKDDEEPVALKAIEFWSSICDEEIDILTYADDSEIPCFYFIKQALPYLVPMLFETLLKQEEDQDEGAWNIAMAGGTCLGLVARTVGDDILHLVIPFIEENISKPDWRQREAATYAFSSILEGPSPEKLVPLVDKASSFMLNTLTSDPSNHVKATIAWTFGKILEFLHGLVIINQENCQRIINVLLRSLTDVPNVAEKACGALYFFARGLEIVGTTFFQEIFQSLLTVICRKDAGESRLRTTAFEALNEVVRCSNDDTDPVVAQLVTVILKDLDQTLEKHNVEYNDRQNELQGHLCGLLQVMILKLGLSEPTKQHLMQHADQIMILLLSVFASRSATVHEEAMLAIGALAYVTGPEFVKYMQTFSRYLIMGLQNYADYQVCAITVGVVGDVCRALEEEILPFCDEIMTQLLRDLCSDQLDRSLEPLIFSCFGDIALAIGVNFEKYLLFAMSLLEIAAKADDDYMTEYKNAFRNGILEAYSGIFIAFKGSLETRILMCYAPKVVQFLERLYIESRSKRKKKKKDMDDVTKAAIGMLGDLVDTLVNTASSLIQQSGTIKEFLDECLSSEDQRIKEYGVRAMLIISLADSY